MVYLAFIGGVILGTVLAHIWFYRKTEVGYFTIDPVDDPSEESMTHIVSVHIPNEKQLIETKRIVLNRDKTQK